MYMEKRCTGMKGQTNVVVIRHPSNAVVYGIHTFAHGVILAVLCFVKGGDEGWYVPWDTSRSFLFQGIWRMHVWLGSLVIRTSGATS